MANRHLNMASMSELSFAMTVMEITATKRKTAFTLVKTRGVGNVAIVHALFYLPWGTTYSQSLYPAAGSKTTDQPPRLA